MARLFLALLIALLPLRGWVGEVMATDMAAAWTAQHHAAAPARVMPAADAALAVADAHDHCAGHEATAAEAAAPASHADCSTCASCQACHAVALVAGIAGLTGQPLPMAPPVARHHAFSSAEPAPGLKPPIS